MQKDRTKNWIKVIILSLGIILTTFFVIISFILLYRCYNPKTHEQKLLVSYNSEDNLNYTLKTIENDFYTDDDLHMNQNYVSSIIDKINFDISYVFESSRLLDYEYTYSIIANLKSNYINDTTNQELWSKEFILEPETLVIKEDINYIEIKENFEIDYKTYNSIMKSFIEEFNLDVNAYLDIVFKVNVKSTVGSSNQIDENDTINITIPLLKEVTNIDYETTGIINNDVLTTIDDVEQTSVFIKIMYGIGIVLSSILDFILLAKVYNTTEKDRYFYEINKIFKNYEEVLVNVEEIPEHLKLKTIKVSNFKDMVDVNDELHLPILYFEEKNKVSFFIMNETYFYTYIIKREKINDIK